MRRLCAGAKEAQLISDYRDQLGIARFDLAIDWGWFEFLTKPFRDRDPVTIAGIRNMYGRTPLAGYLGCATAIRNMDLRTDDAVIVCPTLIIVGEQDPATTVTEARKLNTAIKGSKLTIIPEAAHISVIEQAAAVTRALGDWLAAQ